MLTFTLNSVLSSLFQALGPETSESHLSKLYIWIAQLIVYLTSRLLMTLLIADCCELIFFGISSSDKDSLLSVLVPVVGFSKLWDQTLLKLDLRT